MKAKILSIILSVAIAVTFIPSVAFATAGSSVAGTHKVSNLGYNQYKIIKMTYKGTPKYSLNVANNDLDSIQQQCYELLNETYTEYVSKKEKYNEDVWNEINCIYNTELEVINNADSIDDITTTGWFGLEPSERISEAMVLIELLGSYTLRNGYDDLDVAKSQVLDIYNSVFSGYKKSDYNTYYWELIEEQKGILEEEIQSVPSPSADVNSRYENLKGYAEYALIEAEIESYSMEADEEDDYIVIVISEGDDEFELEDSWVYTKSEMSSLKSKVTEELKDYVDTSISDYKLKHADDKAAVQELKDNLNEIFAYYNTEIKNCATAEDAFQVLDEGLYVAFLIIQQYEDPYVSPSSGDLTRLMTAIEDLADNYIKSNYSDTMWSKLNEIFDEEIYESVYDFTYTKEQAKTKDSRKEARDEYVAKVKAKADKILTKNQEVYYNKLYAAYKGVAKYNQTTVKSLLAKASDALSSCESDADLTKVYNDYNSQLSKALATYKITTSKSGKGTISASKTVKYGSNCTVTFKAKKGYKVKTVTVDGKKVKAKKKYTFKNVTKAHTIKVKFGK